MLKKMDHEGEMITNIGFPQNQTTTAASKSNSIPPVLKRKRNLPGNPGMLIDYSQLLSLFLLLFNLSLSLQLYDDHRYIQS